MLTSCEPVGASAAEPGFCLQDQPGQPIILQEMLTQLFRQLEQEQQSSSSSNGTSPVCSSSSGIDILPAAVAAAPGAVQLQHSSHRDGTAAAEAAKAAAQAAAALNADAGNAQRYNAPEVSLGPCTSLHRPMRTAALNMLSAGGLLRTPLSLTMLV